MVLQVVVRVLVHDPGPGHRLVEAVASLPRPAPPCVGEVGIELAALGLDVRPVLPEQVPDGSGAATQSANRDASETARERGAFDPVALSQLDAPACAVGAQLADRRTAGLGWTQVRR